MTDDDLAISWIHLLLALAAGVVSVVMTPSPTPSGMAGQFFGAFLVALVLIWLAVKVFGGDSNGDD